MENLVHTSVGSASAPQPEKTISDINLGQPNPLQSAPQPEENQAQPAAETPQQPVEAVEPKVQEKPEQRNIMSSERFQELSRQEVALRRQMDEVKKLQQEALEVKERYSKYDGLENKIKENPLGFLEENGIDSGSVIDQMIGKQEKPAPDPLEKIKELEAQLAEHNKKLEEDRLERERQQQEQTQQQQRNSFINDLKGIVSSDSAKYGLLDNDGAYDFVIETALQANQEQGLTFETPEKKAQLLKYVNDYYVEEAKANIEKYKRIGLLEANQPQQPTPTPQQAVAPQQKKVPPTLSNKSLAGNNPINRPPAENFSSLGHDDRIAALAAKYDNQIKE